ncbi:hypothetical protein WH47_00614 [Habropoda laboriosa]|uniref:Uncharacterized protein n=1 Tax=Habropoda laboriosa TaxID=597456 RepID=A0A0L7RI20_9HYME|nr:hypothetical protein WH47_00614 [Habropoda laboriosa]
MDLSARPTLSAISLPRFNRDYNSRVKFRNMFESIICNNESLYNIQTFHYLNSTLKAKPVRVI